MHPPNSQRFRRRFASALATATVLGTVLAATATPAAAAAPQPITAGTGNPAFSVPGEVLRMAAGSPVTLPLTLITGDTVHIGVSTAGKPVVRDIEPAGRADGKRVVFHTITRSGNLHVVPNDALSLLGNGILDWGLFDVAKLAALAATGKLGQVPVLVTYTDKAGAQRAVAVAGATEHRPLASINGRSVTIEGGGRWWRDVLAGTDARSPASARAAGPLTGVQKIWLNELVRINLEQSVPQIGAPVAWARGHDGTGVTVAVLDTGIDATHPDVAGRVAGRADFTGTSPEAVDGHGHGTHVAATIAGTGAASSGRLKGVAPGAKLLVGKVCDNGGSCPTDAVIGGMEWAAQSEAKVVSMSLGGGATDGTDPMSQSLNNLSRATGKLYVVAAGNSGPGAQTVGAPGAADEALTVAAVDKNDQMASFSSRGPRVGDGAAKPDIAGPGVNIVAARAAGTSMGTVVDQYYTTASGTSMATPHVAGAAAIVAAKHPAMTGEQLKGLLMQSSLDLGHDLYAQGAGRVDLARAIDPSITTSGSLNYGRHEYPHAPVGRTHTYTNHTTEAVTLRLSASATVGGTPGPAGLFGLSSTEITVPANGQASVTLTVDGGVLGDSGPYGAYNGLLSATDTSGTLRAASRISAFLEPIRHQLTVNVIPPNGATSVSYGNAVITPVDDKVLLHDEPTAVPGAGSFGARLFAGTFAAGVSVEWRDAAGRLHQAVPLAPEVTLTKATTVTLDLRRLKPVAVRTPQATETYDAVTRFERVSATGVWGVSAELLAGYGPAEPNWWALPTEPVRMGTFTYNTSAVLVTPAVTMTAIGEGRPLELAVRYGTPDSVVSGGRQQIGDDTRDTRVKVPRLPTKGKLRVVAAGTGTAEEISKVDVSGRLVLISPSDICDARGCDFAALRGRVAAAATAGAAGVLAATPAGLGSPPEAVLECPDGPDSCPAPQPYAALPIVNVPTADAAKLLARLGEGPVLVALGGDARPEVYTVAFNTATRIPDALPHRLDRDGVERVEHRLHSGHTGAVTGLAWSQWVRSQPDPLTMNLPVVAMQNVLETYVNRQADAINRYQLSWADYAAPSVLGPVRSEYQEVVLGRSGAVRWNTGPTVPGAVPTVRTASGFTVSSGTLCAGCRQGDVFYPTYFVTSSSGARQAMVGIVNNTGIAEYFFGISGCEATACDFKLRNASGAEFERRLQRVSFGIGDTQKGR